MKISVIKNKKEKYNYFEEFVKNINYGVECSKIVQKNVKSFKQSELSNSLKEVHLLENKADEGKHEMVNYLAKDFVPPIDREDILKISQRIDDVIDYVEDILINIDIYNVTEIREEAKEFSDLLVLCIENTCELIRRFKDYKKIEAVTEKVIQINDIEGKGDLLYISAMKKLYKENLPAIEVMKWSTIFGCFENSMDRCESLASAIEETMVKIL